MDTTANLIAFIVGFLSSTIVVYFQFRGSTARFRVNSIIQATKDFKEGVISTSSLRNRYRYSLGVIIDNLHQMKASGFIDSQELIWPHLIGGNNEDRWVIFDRYVRPVVNDLTPYAFLGGFFFLPLVYEMNLIMKLCQQLEKVVMELDSAYEFNPPIFELGHRGIQPLRADDPRLENLKNAYSELYVIWQKWERVATQPSYNI